MNPYLILGRKRAGGSLSRDEIRATVDGAVDGSWSDAQLGAFLMAAAIRGLDATETQELTLAMLESGELWLLREEVSGVVDKHSTGGVGDKVSLILGPLLAACEVPVVMLTGRALGHTGGTADKLECIPGLELALDRQRCLRLLDEELLAIGVATAAIAPADRRLYALRDQTSTVSSLPLVVSSILSKKLAVGPAGVVFDVKTGSGAFFPELDDACELAQRMVETCAALEVSAAAVVSDMSQPLGRWVGLAAEVQEAYECLTGRGESRLMELVLLLAQEGARRVGRELGGEQLQAAIDSGTAVERFASWAAAQGAERAWLERPRFDLALHEEPVRMSESGILAAVDTRRLGLLMHRAARCAEGVDCAVALRYDSAIGHPVEAGEALARLYLRAADPELATEVASCFEVGVEAQAPPLVYQKLG